MSEYGLWDQLRVDQGKEWYLMLLVQERLAHLRYNTARASHLDYFKIGIVFIVIYFTLYFVKTIVWVRR